MRSIRHAYDVYDVYYQQQGVLPMKKIKRFDTKKIMFDLYHECMHVFRFFKLYKPWKVFSTWKIGLKRSKILAAGAALSKNLFLFNPPLRSALLLVRQLSGPLTSLGILSIPSKDTFDIHDFISAQSEGMSSIKCIL